MEGAKHPDWDKSEMDATKNGNPQLAFQMLVVGQAPDGTILDIFSMGASGDIQVGDQITVVAYPVGLVTVDNKLGGQTDQLALVTNKL